MKRRIISLLLAVLVLGASVLCASADAFIPPEYIPYNITNAHRFDGECYALNVFLSNFVEIGLKRYNSNTSPSEMTEAVLKHLEINAEFFADDVTRVDGDDGKTYMRITESIFNTRMRKLFGHSIPASDCPGYENGSILVSAEHFGGPIQVFASVYNCEKEADGVYRAYFDAYLVNEDFSGWHRTANNNLPAKKLTLLGKGEALVGYTGDETVASISSSDFTLVQWSMDAQGIPCAGANLPYGVEETEPPTQAPTEEATQPVTQAAEEEPTETAPIVQEKDFDEDNAGGIGFGTLVIIVVLVVVVAVLAFVLILVLIKKKK